MNLHIGALIRQWRAAAGISLSRLALEAGVGKSTLSNWENSRTTPSLRELERVLACLKVTAEQRRMALHALHALHAPRAIVQLTAEGDRPPVAGDLLRVMRRRRKITQADLARSVGVTQGMIAKWERSEDWPSAERLHALAFALGAYPDEVCVLVNGRFTPRASLEGRFDLDAARAYYQATIFITPLPELERMSLIAQFWPAAQQNAAAYSFLTFLYATHTRHLFNARRFAEADLYVNRVMERVQGRWDKEETWLDALMTQIILMRSRGRSQASALVDQVAESLPHVKNNTFRAWMYSEMAVGLAMEGLGDLAVKSSMRAIQTAEMAHEPYTEGYFRRYEHLNILLMLKDVDRLKRFVEEPQREAMQGYLQGDPGMFSGQMALIRALYLLGDDTEAERECAWLEGHISAHGLEAHRPHWDELRPVRKGLGARA